MEAGMALEERTRLYEFLARLDRTPEGDRIVGMQVQTITEILRDGEVIAATINPATPLDWAGLAAMMHPDDRSALLAALE
jgi:hypothetical protein